VTEPAFDLEAVLGAAYAVAVGVSIEPEAALVDALRAEILGGGVTVAAIEARRDALRAVEARCIVSKLQAAFLDRVLAV
jgi:hypothetical protein